MADKFNDPLLTPKDVARHLRIPKSTVYYWLRENAAGAPMMHQVVPESRGRPSVPFVAVIEAYVLRSLRDLGLSRSKIRAAAAEVRGSFQTPYALATQEITTDGVDTFAQYPDSDLVRVDGRHLPVRELIDDRLRYINWDSTDGFARSLRLRQYPKIASVIIDPRFGSGAPVVESTKVPVSAVVDLWAAGETLERVAYEYDLTRDQAEAICRVAARAA